jgi:hypothetical protein
MKGVQVKLKVFALILILGLSGCTGAANSQLKQCQVLADNYSAEWKASQDAFIANGGVGTSESREHMRRAGDYHQKFSDLGCEEKCARAEWQNPPRYLCIRD